MELRPKLLALDDRRLHYITREWLDLIHNHMTCCMGKFKLGVSLRSAIPRAVQLTLERYA
jgi:hypothetical protein